MKFGMKAKSLLLICVLVLAMLFVACGESVVTTENGQETTPADTVATTSPVAEDTTPVTTEPVVTEAEKPFVGNPTIIGYPSSESDTLPILSIKTEDGQAIKSKDVYINATVSASGTLNDEAFGFTDLTSEIRCRGNYTFSGTEKKSYRLKFTEKINLFGQGNGPAKSWVLLANHCDQTFLRNHIAFTMGRQLSNISYCTSSSFVKLYINDEYVGIYQLAEQHQVNQYRVNINEDPNVVDTDYLIERDSYANNDCTRGLDYFQIDRTKYRVHSDAMTEEKCTFLENYFVKAQDAVENGSQGTVSRYVDIDSLIDTMILQAFMKNTDVGYSSFYMVKKAGGKIYFTCPWDFDLALGNDERLDKGAVEGLYVGVKSDMSQEHEWFYLLMNQKWFCDLLLKRWNEVKQSLYDAAIYEIDRILLCFEDDMASNFDVWTKVFGKKINQEPRAIRALRSYKAHVDYLRDWYTKRYTYLDELLNSDELYNQGGYYSGGDWWWGGW